MSRIRSRTVVIAILGLLALAPSARAALGISLPTTATLVNLGPGRTATATGISVTVTGLGSWTLTVTPEASATPGHLRATSGTCTGSETALTHALHMDTTGTLGTTVLDTPSYTASSGTTQIAHGTVPDVLTVAYSQLVDNTEVLRSGCVYSANLTFTVS